MCLRLFLVSIYRLAGLVHVDDRWHILCEVFIDYYLVNILIGTSLDLKDGLDMTLLYW